MRPWGMPNYRAHMSNEHRRRLTVIASRIKKDIEARNQAISDALADGASRREVGEIFGTSHQQVANWMRDFAEKQGE